MDEKSENDFWKKYWEDRQKEAVRIIDGNIAKRTKPTSPDEKVEAKHDTKIHRCLIHNEAEVSVPGAPHCPECWHQFLSYEDLLEQDLELRKKLRLMTNAPATGQDVDCCPLCAHDL